MDLGEQTREQGALEVTGGMDCLAKRHHGWGRQKRKKSVQGEVHILALRAPAKEPCKAEQVWSLEAQHSWQICRVPWSGGKGRWWKEEG